MATAVDLFCLLCLALNIALSMLLELVTNLRPVNDNVTNKTICKLKRHYFIVAFYILYISHWTLMCQIQKYLHWVLEWCLLYVMEQWTVDRWIWVIYSSFLRFFYCLLCEHEYFLSLPRVPPSHYFSKIYDPCWLKYGCLFLPKKYRYLPSSSSCSVGNWKENVST